MEKNIFLCQKCRSAIFSKENDEKVFQSNNNIKITEENNFCEFCFNSLNENKYEDLIIKIGESIKEYEYMNLNIQTRFSCLFQIFHSILINELFILDDDNKKVISQTIKSSILRKSFKEKFFPIFSNKLNLKIDSNPGDMIILILFNFTQNIYDILNSIFEPYRTKESNLPIISENDDNSTIKYYIDLIYDINHFSNILEQFNKKLTPEILTSNFYLEYKIEIAPFYICGNYIKLDREIGQTQFSKNGVKLSLSSVDEELKNFLKKIFLNNSSDLVFSAGGREDRDVRMLREGREFIYTIYNAKKHYSLDFFSINKILNDTLQKVKVKNLRICDKKYFEKLKNTENEKIKIYEAVVWTKKSIDKDSCEKINKVDNLKINQITPLRVLHKRVLKTREKIIYKLNIKEIINPHFMILEVKSSAGTYIKEFINGDLGRTFPSLGDIIGNECDIIQLDVQDIII
jgi:tRNA U54 and U55 pseudouridine synthase Pus10